MNQAILTKDNPLGDVFFGVDNTFLTRALDAGIFEPYTVAGARPRCPRRCSSTRRHRVTPIDYGDVCVNYDKAWFATPRRRRSRRRSTTSPSPRTRTCSWSRTRRRRRPGSRSCSRRSREFGDDGWQRLLGAAARQRRAGRRRLGAGVRQRVLRRRRQAATARSSSRYASSPPAEVVLRRPADRRRAPIGALTDDVLPPGRVRRRARRAPSTRPRPGSSSTSCSPSSSRTTCRCRCSCSRRATGTPLPPVFAKFADVADRPATRCRRRDRRATATSGSTQWTEHRAAVTRRCRRRRGRSRRARSRSPLAFLARVLRVAGRRDPRPRPARPTARSTSARSATSLTDPALRARRVVHGLAGGALDRAHAARRRSPARTCSAAYGSRAARSCARS